jgi:hypothetical protein
LSSGQMEAVGPKASSNLILGAPKGAQTTHRCRTGSHSGSAAADSLLADGHRRTDTPTVAYSARSCSCLREVARSARRRRAPGTCTTCPVGTRHFEDPRARARARHGTLGEKCEAL